MIFFFGSRKRTHSIYVTAVGWFSLSDRTFDANTIVIYTYDGIMYIYVRVCARTPRLNPREHGTFRLPFLRFVFFVPGNRFLKTIIIPCNNLDRTYGFSGVFIFSIDDEPTH